MTREIKIAFGLLALLFAACLYSAAPSAEDIKKCVSAGVWTKQRCEVELSR